MVDLTVESETSGDLKNIDQSNEPIHVVKINHIPYGFFEKQLWDYFRQFGKVVRTRVARSTKTGNHKGWAYVGFADKDVAEIAAESMDGYLMFEKRLTCHVMKPENIPKSMKYGPRFVDPPKMKAQAKKMAIGLNRRKSVKLEKKGLERRQRHREMQINKLKSFGVEYSFENILPNTSTAATEGNISENDSTRKK